MPCGLTAMSYGNSPLATFPGVSGRSAPEPSEANWEISFVPPLPVTYTNGAPAGDAAGAGAPATVHPAASPQAITARTAVRPIRRPPSASRGYDRHPDRSPIPPLHPAGQPSGYSAKAVRV